MYAHWVGARRVDSPTKTSPARAQAQMATTMSSPLRRATATRSPATSPSSASRSAAPSTSSASSA